MFVWDMISNLVKCDGSKSGSYQLSNSSRDSECLAIILGSLY